jgi:amino-acid N-acetyltransferase
VTAADIAYFIRKAVAEDEAAIQALVRSERLNPNDLRYENFAVAVRDDELIGATQIRRHPDGSRELGSLVVARPWRGRGISGELIDFVLKSETGIVHVITRRAHAAHYARWGFAADASRAAPAKIRFNYRVGSVLGTAMALLQRRRINRLTILRRDAPPLFRRSYPRPPAGEREGCEALGG